MIKAPQGGTSLNLELMNGRLAVPKTTRNSNAAMGLTQPHFPQIEKLRRTGDTGHFDLTTQQDESQMDEKSNAASRNRPLRTIDASSFPRKNANIKDRSIGLPTNYKQKA